MAKVGQAAGDEERKSKSMRHWLQYGLRMTSRRDNGGRDLDEVGKRIASSISGLTDEQRDLIASAVNDEIYNAVRGITLRQSRTLNDFAERLDVIDHLWSLADRLGDYSAFHKDIAVQLFGTKVRDVQPLT